MLSSWSVEVEVLSLALLAAVAVGLPVALAAVAVEPVPDELAVALVHVWAARVVASRQVALRAVVLWHVFRCVEALAVEVLDGVPAEWPNLIEVGQPPRQRLP